jgi:truncated hemoglobin YjbI
MNWTQRIVLLAGICLFMTSQTVQAQQKSLYERLGGVHAIAAVVDDFVNRLIVNPVIGSNPRTVASLQKIPVPAIKFQLTAMLCQVSGGPQKYFGHDMKAAHMGLMISDAEWDAAAADLKATLDKFNVPEKEQQEIFVLVSSTKPDIVTSDPTPRKTNMRDAKMGKKGSLYERLGGVYAIAAVVDDFVNRLLQNPVILGNPRTVEAAGSGRITVPGLKYLLTEQLCEATGGPHKYTGRNMKESHKNLAISDKEWESSVQDLIATLNKFKVPEKERKELLRAIEKTRKDVQSK